MSEHKSLKGKLQQDINDTWNENGILTDYTFFMEKDLRDAVAGLLEELEKDEMLLKVDTTVIGVTNLGVISGLTKARQRIKKWLPDCIK